jgi:hypothetical protein
LGLLIDKLPDEGNRADRLGEHLERLDGPLTRKWVQGLRESIAPNQRRKKAEESPTEDEEAPESAGVEDRHQVDAEIDESGDVSNIDESEDQNATMRKEASVPSSAKRAEVLIEEAGEPIAAALLIVSNSDDGAVERATEYARCQDLADQMAKDSAIFVFARMNVLLNIIRVVQIFHPVFRCANLYLLSGSDKLEATDCNVFAIFERGDGVFVDGVPNWKADDTPLQTVWQLLRGVPGRRLQIFADAPVAGWETPDFGEH